MKSAAVFDSWKPPEECLKTHSDTKHRKAKTYSSPAKRWHCSDEGFGRLHERVGHPSTREFTFNCGGLLANLLVITRELMQEFMENSHTIWSCPPCVKANDDESIETGQIGESFLDSEPFAVE